MDAAQALADLTEISSQIEAAILFTSEGAVLASTLGDEAATARVAEAAQALLRAVEETQERPEFVQLEAATLNGSVFVVRDGERAVAAITTPEPTVGLVFYDLKSCLHAAAAENDAKPRPRARQTAKKADGGT